jgi:hydroxymethylbilane synthase
MASNSRKLRLGTRGSKLAKWQAEWVVGQLERLGQKVELIEIATSGDLQQVAAVEGIGTRGVFTKEIQWALLKGEVHLAVHSLKDLPTEPVKGLVLAAVPARESTADVLVLPEVTGIEPPTETLLAANDLRTEIRVEAGGDGGWRTNMNQSVLSTQCSVLPHGARVGTGSLRRQAQLRYVRPDLRVADVRGNVETRLRKLDEGQFDAIVLAEAGLRRLGLIARVSEVLSTDVMLPAVGQGALGIECRADDANTRAILTELNDSATRTGIMAERALLEHLRGGCMAPIGALGRVVGDKLQLAAVVLNADGSRRLAASEAGSPSDAEALGLRVADKLLSQGAAELIASSRNG